MQGGRIVFTLPRVRISREKHLGKMVAAFGTPRRRFTQPLHRTPTNFLAAMPCPLAPVAIRRRFSAAGQQYPCALHKQSSRCEGAPP